MALGDISKILLFGGSGVMGTAIDRICRAAGIQCIQPDHDQVDVTDPAKVDDAILRHAPQVVINAVALIGYDICERNPAEAFRTNSLPASFMARACEDRQLTFVQLSSHAVFDGLKDSPYTENDLPNPLNSYGITKYMAELYCRNLCSRHYVVRLPTLFGQRRNQRPGFVDKVLMRAADGEELRIAADKIDSPTYSLDAARGLIAILREDLPSGVYHLANGGAVSYYDFVVALLRGIDSSATVTPARDADFPFCGRKPLKTALSSELLPAMRSWQDAFADYLQNGDLP